MNAYPKTHPLLALLTGIFLCSASLAQSPDQNYIRTRVPRVKIKTVALLDQYTPAKDSVMTTVQYVDGLGRPLQTVQQQASPSGKDIVQPVLYDAFGREAVRYLPYAVSTGLSDGSYKTDALTPGSGVAKFYNPSGNVNTTVTQQSNGMVNTAYPFSVTGFEPSPLNRVVEQGAPGAAWQFTGPGDAGSGSHTSRMVWTTNDQTGFNTNGASANNPGSRRAALYTVTINADQSRTLGRANNWVDTYDDNQLYVTITRDENWQPGDGCMGTTEEYKDKEGRVVLKRTYNLARNTSNALVAEILSTYYVYDDLGNLCFVLTPGANPDNLTAITQSYMDGRCYQYRYDERNRLTQKKLPGKGWEFMVYNTLDQVVLTQDALQRNRAPQEWTFSKYDAIGRVVMSGVWKNTGSVADASSSAPGTQSLMALASQYKTTTSPKWESRDAGNTATGYSNVSEPLSTVTYLNISYYDSYEGIPSLPATYDQHTNPAYSQMTTGLLTATKTWVLNSTDALWAVPYYDEEGQVIRSFGQHYLGGASNLSEHNYDDRSTIYDFNNQPKTVSRKHYTKSLVGATAVLALTVTDYYTYDHMGRKRKTSEQVKHPNVQVQQTIVIAQTDYNEIGQAKKKGLHSITNGASFLQNVDYRYNPRGWLTSINNAALTADGIINTGTNDKFGMELSYEQTAQGRPQYNGNISSVKWKLGPVMMATPVTQVYDYAYDRLNRLTEGVSTEGALKDSYYNEHLRYDKAGNITTLGRYDKPSNVKIQIDSLTYTYNGYQHTRVDDVPANVGKGGFDDRVQVANEYTYDLNGNMRKDLNKEISTITYNIMNLPQTITKSNGSTVVYVYDALGRKLRKVSSIGGNTTTTEYVDGIQYEAFNNGGASMIFFQTEEGRAQKSGTTYIYEYDLKDHLGNTRATVTADPADPNQLTAKVLQENSYYPFGATIASQQPVVSSPPNRYLYNGKELQDETQLYDYGARYYDALVGRWTSVDPLAEKSRKYSSYVYGNDNPIRFIDPDGMFSTDVTKNDDGTYKVVAAKADGDRNVYVQDSHGQRTGQVIGKTVTDRSFLNDNGKAVVGAQINLSDKSGASFLNNLFSKRLSHYVYKDNAHGGQKYDYKTNGPNGQTNGIAGIPLNQQEIYQYRGGVVNGVPGLGENSGLPTIASARDVGNIAAGFVAGSNNLTWNDFRLAADRLETKQQGHLAVEGQTSQLAQRVGYSLGISAFNSDNPIRGLFRLDSELPVH